MMKRILACLLAAACLLACCGALAEGTMEVIKCKQYVNLREGPNTDSASLAQVPLGTLVTDCAPVAGSDWFAVNYNGVAGYIRGDFLKAVEEAPAVVEAAPAAEEVPAVVEQAPVEAVPAPPVIDVNAMLDENTILDAQLNGVRVIARRVYGMDSEALTIVGVDDAGNALWQRETATGDISELTQTEAFIGGTGAMPLVMMYNDWVGLTALDPLTGATRWELLKEQVFLGGSVSWAVGGNGILYIGGYYGPDPVAIDAGGNVLWQSDSGSSDIFWLYSIELESDRIVCQYGSVGEGAAGMVEYEYNGALREIVAE